MPYSKYLSSLDIKVGDTLLVASNILQLGVNLKKEGIKFGSDDMISSLQRLLGPDGTLLFPAFNYDFSSQKGYDYLHSPPQNMGALSNQAFKRKDFMRTKHPVFSFFVSGKKVQKYYKLNNISAFAKESPFDLMYQDNAKMLFIDIEYNRSYTFIHYVEEIVGVQYRYFKDFTSTYKDHNSLEEQRTYTLLVRDLEKGVINSSNPIGKILEQKNVSKTYNILGVKFALVDLKKAYKIIEEDILFNESKNLISYTK